MLSLVSVLCVTYDSKLHLVRTKSVYAIYSVLICALTQGPYWIISSMFVESFTAIEKTYSPVSEMVYIVEVWAIDIAYIIFLWNALFNRFKQVKFLNKVLEIEGEILKFHRVTCNKKWKRTSLKYFFAVFLFYVIISFFKFFYVFEGNSERKFILLFYAFGAFYFSTLIILLLMIVKVQRHLFWIILKELKMMLHASNYNVKEISKICELHNQLYGTIKMFNESFGLCYVGIFFYNVGMHTCQLYIGPYSATIQKLPNIFKFNACLNGFWTLPSLLLCAMLGHECEKTKCEAEKTRSLMQFEVDLNKRQLNDLVHNNLHI